MRTNFTRLEALAEFLQLSAEQTMYLNNTPRFSLNVPMRLACKMEKGTLNDPLLRQFLPLVQEKNNQAGFKEDPVGDIQFRRSGKLLHKYQGRVLLVCTSACAMHCRYCFRQNFDYQVDEKGFTKELELIAADASIHEVILSGGDPLSLSDAVLADLLQQLNAISHVRRLRFHTRFPIGIPQRIDRGLLSALEQFERQLYCVLHINHPRELDEELFQYLNRLQKGGVILLNQAVLLKGIDDDLATQRLLCEQLIDRGILPYYLHQLDRVRGTAHFEVEESFGLALVQDLARALPGYGVPRYVREIEGEPSKTPLM